MTDMEEQSQLPKLRRPAIFHLVSGYYIATPVFIIIELLWGAGFRVPFILANPFIRYSYYAVCLGCGAGCYLRPRAVPFIALFESTINVILVFVGYGIAVTTARLLVVETGEIPEILTVNAALGFFVSGSIAVFSFHHCENIVGKILKEKMRS